MTLSRRAFGLGSLAALGSLATPAILRPGTAAARGEGQARNVILMIADGAGFHSWTTTSLYQHGALGGQVYDRFPVRTLMTTYPLNTATAPTGQGRAAVAYDPTAAWSDEPLAGDTGGRRPYPRGFRGYDYVRQDFTDSAAAGTALSAGIKTYNSAINWTDTDQPARMMGERVKATGRALGVVTSVQVSHATPAAFLCHNRSRTDYAGLGAEIVETGLADVVMGSGHPVFDNNGIPRAPTDERAFRFVGGHGRFVDLVSGNTPYHFLDTRADFEALAEGRLRLARPQVLGLAPVHSSLQYSRAGSGMGGMIRTVPALATMTRGALRVLGAKPDGFFLMVEGGAVDWACHANNLGRMIEEQIAFNRAVEAVVAWVEAESSWDETLVIVTTDHGNGMIYGPESLAQAFQPVGSRGERQLPAVRWHFNDHTNELVPVWARGAGATLLEAAARGVDENTGLVGWGDVTRFHDNTDVARTMAMAMAAPD